MNIDLTEHTGEAGYRLLTEIASSLPGPKPSIPETPPVEPSPQPASPDEPEPIPPPVIA